MPKQVTLRIPDDIHNAVKKRCKNQQISFTAYTVNLLKDSLTRRNAAEECQSALNTLMQLAGGNSNDAEFELGYQRWQRFWQQL